MSSKMRAELINADFKLWIGHVIATLMLFVYVCLLD